MCVLGIMYAKGRGVRENESKAVEYFAAAAAQDDPEAQFNLGTAAARTWRL
jgi:TPR repeat protein